MGICRQNYSFIRNILTYKHNTISEFEIQIVFLQFPDLSCHVIFELNKNNLLVNLHFVIIEEEIRTRNKLARKQQIDYHKRFVETALFECIDADERSEDVKPRTCQPGLGLINSAGIAAGSLSLSVYLSLNVKSDHFENKQIFAS